MPNKDICNEWFMLQHSAEPVTSNEVKREILQNNRFITIDEALAIMMNDIEVVLYM